MPSGICQIGKMFKTNEILLYATIWLNLQDAMLSEISQSHKDKHSYDSTYMRLLSCQIHGDRQ